MPYKSITARQSSGNLNFSTAQKIIHGLLTHDRIKAPLDEGKCRSIRSDGLLDYEPIVKLAPYSMQELADKLGISMKYFN